MRKIDLVMSELDNKLRAAMDPHLAAIRGLGQAEGRFEGRKQIALRLLAARFGPLTEETQARVSRAHGFAMYDLADVLLTAPTLEEALRVLSPCSVDE